MITFIFLDSLNLLVFTFHFLHNFHKNNCIYLFIYFYLFIHFICILLYFIYSLICICIFIYLFVCIFYLFILLQQSKEHEILERLRMCVNLLTG